ncbi:MAG: amphi-Trp domain-containing protein [Thermodesulfobacteria bacterium]|nr:amphi-Trp domain-containing protein [Thermodesulfobacteriota bacterium]
MAEKKVLFKSEEPRSLEDVARFLRELADRLSQGKVVLRRGGEEITLNIPPNVVLELKAEEKVKPSKTKYSLEIEIEWGEGEGTGPVSLG